MQSKEDNGIFPAVCPLDCPDMCGLLLHKRNGKIVKIEGDPKHPITAGAICNKVRNMTERIYHQERVLYPLRRVGNKGEGRFERITWKEALDEIAGHYHHLIHEYGAESILPYNFYGNMGYLSVQGMDRRFFHRLGASKLQRSICNSAGAAGWNYTMGFGGGVSPEDAAKAKLFIVWGANIVSTSMHKYMLIEAARKQGAKLVVIDVHKNKTGDRADWFIPVHPGTDAALALGLMHVLFERGLTDEAFLSTHTVGHEKLREHVKTYTPELVSEITGVPAGDILRLAQMYADTPPAYIHIGNGLQHHDNGGMAVRTIACLPALIGAWWIKGGGAYKSNMAYGTINGAALEKPELREEPEVRTINMVRLGEALLELKPPIRSLFVYCSNPAVVAPDTERVLAGLMREDLFTVVHDLFLTDTAKYADIVLPATSTFENMDIYGSYWHHFMHMQEPVIPAEGESKSNFELFQLLAEAMGFKEQAFRETEEDLIRHALDFKQNPYLNGVTLDRLKEQHYVKLNMEPQMHYLDQLDTPSGKIELYSRLMEEEGLPPLPTYIPLTEGYDGQHRPGSHDLFPLMFISPPNHNFLNSTFANVEKLANIEKKPLLQIHPVDAGQRSIRSGDQVKIWNDRGCFEAEASVTERMLPGTVVSQGLWWGENDKQIRANALTSDRLADMGGGATFFSTVVEVRLCRRHSED